VGSKFPSTYGLFGGYGAPTYPLCKVKGMNAFEILAELPEEKWTIPHRKVLRSFDNVSGQSWQDLSEKCHYRHIAVLRRADDNAPRSFLIRR